MNSIRRRLHRALFLALAVLASLFGLTLHLVFRSALVGEFDDNQRLLAQALSTAFEQLPEGEIEFDPPPDLAARFADRSQPEYFQVWTADETLTRSPSLHAADLPRRAGRDGQPEVWNLTLPDGRSGRALGFEFELRLDTEDAEAAGVPVERRPPPPKLALVYARSREPMDRVLLLSALSFAAMALLLPLCGALLLGRIVRRGLSPLDRLSDEIRAVEPSNLVHQFSESGLPEELRPIVERLNGLLERVRRAIEREQRFSSDVAHELRTPIAELRTLAEVALSVDGGDAPDSETRRSFEDALEIALQMERVVSTLFVLMRARGGEVQVEVRELDAAAIVRSLWPVWSGKAEAKGLRCEVDLPGPVPVQADEALLRALLSNVLENAVAHAPEGGAIEARLESSGDRRILTVSNTNATLEERDLPRLFEPFWQKDPSRTESGHAGLGLSTAAAFAELMGIELRPSLPKPDRFEMRISFPPQR